MSSNLRKPRDAYHHGNLRDAILRVARRELDLGAYESLSLRELAKRAGVTANAPYRHFASKEDILAELAAEGFRELSARFDAYLEPDPRLRLIRMSDVYTGYAMDYPHLYRLMFGMEKTALMEHAPLHEAAIACFGRLVEGVARAGQTGGIDDPLTLRRANAIWAIVHGWSRLAIDGMTSFQPIDAKPPASEIVAAVVTGWN